jgi:hypothetical protein
MYKLFDHGLWIGSSASEREPAFAIASENPYGDGGLLALIVIATVHRDFLKGWRTNVGRSRGCKAGIVGVIASACTLGAVCSNTIVVANLRQTVGDGLVFVAANTDGRGSGRDCGLILSGRLAAIALLSRPGC